MDQGSRGGVPQDCGQSLTRFGQARVEPWRGLSSLRSHGLERLRHVKRRSVPVGSFAEMRPAKPTDFTNFHECEKPFPTGAWRPALMEVGEWTRW
jgi:hypothetical protein